MQKQNNQTEPSRQESQRDYISITLDTIQLKSIPALDFYIKRKEDDTPILFRSRSFPIHRNDLVALKEGGYNTLWVPNRDYNLYDRYLNENISRIIRDPNVTVDAKCELTYNASSQIMQQVFNSSDPDEVIEASSKVLEPVIEVIFANQTAAHNFIVRTSMDYALYTHSVNVCLYGMALARKSLSITKQDALTRFGPGLLLHDIGKTLIAKEMYTKADPLTEEEWEIMKQLPIRSVEIVKVLLPVTPETESIILHHHERLDGSGYPFGLKGDEISLGARICAIADVFDAINTRRPFQDRKTSFDTFKTMKQEMAGKLDEDLVRDFIYLFLPPQG